MNVIAWVSGREINRDLDKDGKRICPDDHCLYTISYISSDGILRSSVVAAISILKTEAELQLEIRSAALADANAKLKMSMIASDVKMI